MSNEFKFPENYTIEYRLNTISGRYEKQPMRIEFNKLPNELKVELTQDKRIIANGANEIITGRIKGGKREFFTGLISITGFKNFYYGNDYTFNNGTKKNSLVIFKFSEDNRQLIVYYFNSFYKDSRQEREKFVQLFINRLLNQI
jgi:hypothetical protein